MIANQDLAFENSSVRKDVDITKASEVWRNRTDRARQSSATADAFQYFENVRYSLLSVCRTCLLKSINSLLDSDAPRSLLGRASGFGRFLLFGRPFPAL